MAASGKPKRRRQGSTGPGRAEQSRRSLENAERHAAARKRRSVAVALRTPLIAVGIGLILLGGSFWLETLGDSFHTLELVARFVGSMAVGIGAVYVLFTLNKQRRK